MLKLALLAAVSSLAGGQNTTAQLTGMVSDSSGAAIPAAKIRVTNAATGVARDSTSNESGNYTVPLLEPGSYRLEMEKAGFAPVFKTFRLYERLRLQLRGQAEGVMNHPNFAAPNLAPTSSLFGSVNATQTGQEERRIFVGLKLIF
jgi:hypothetical protein